jgi:AraC-like DNA-binding protein
VLLARGHKTIGAGDLRWALTFAPRVWSVVVERRGLVLDTRFIPASVDPARARSCLYLLVRGQWSNLPDGTLLSAPSAFVVTEEQLEGAHGARPFTFSATGDPFGAIEFHLDDRDVPGTPASLPVPIELSPSAWEAASEVLRLSEHDDRSYVESFTRLLEQLTGDGILSAALTANALQPASRPFALLWSALRPMIERLYLTPTLQEVVAATGVSTRQMDRYIQSFVNSFGLVGDRWRGATLHLRLKLAVILLSADGATVSDVATTVGYGSSDAMARAFRDAGLDSPGVVQERVRDARSPGSVRGPT